MASVAQWGALKMSRLGGVFVFLRTLVRLLYISDEEISCEAGCFCPLHREETEAERDNIISPSEPAECLDLALSF